MDSAEKVEVQIVLFAYLADLAGTKERVQSQGRTVREALCDLTARYPQLASQVWEPNGELNRAISVHLAGRSLAGSKDLDTPLSPGEEIVLLPLVTGG